MQNNPDFLQLIHDLQAIGIHEGDSLLMHSSFKSMGTVEGGIATLIAALRHVLGKCGTLVVPTLTYASVTVENPVFDYLRSPSCVGAISEFVRLMPEAKRSVHPTHSCAAIGCRAEEFTCDHHLDNTPVGIHSPFYKLQKAGGKILMLGCGIGCNTSMHGVEEAAGVFYVLNPEAKPYTMVLPDRTYALPFHRHHISQNGYAQCYARLAEVLEPQYMRQGSIHGAPSTLFDAAKVWETGISVMQKDPTFFVEKQ